MNSQFFIPLPPIWTIFFNNQKHVAVVLLSYRNYCSELAVLLTHVIFLLIFCIVCVSVPVAVLLTAGMPVVVCVIVCLGSSAPFWCISVLWFSSKLGMHILYHRLLADYDILTDRANIMKVICLHRFARFSVPCKNNEIIPYLSEI